MKKSSSKKSSKQDSYTSRKNKDIFYDDESESEIEKKTSGARKKPSKTSNSVVPEKGKRNSASNKKSVHCSSDFSNDIFPVTGRHNYRSNKKYLDSSDDSSDEGIFPVTEKRSSRSNKKYQNFLDYDFFSYDNFSTTSFESNYTQRPKAYKNNLRQVFNDFEILERGNAKFYNYLLLDSRKCRNKSMNWNYLKNGQTGLNDLIDLIFYIGKGTERRAWNHANDARKSLKSDLETYFPKKSKQQSSVKEWIIDIWKDGGSVFILILADNITSEDAHTREAAMIDAIGLGNLTNKISGSYYGVASTMSTYEKRNLGATLLMDAKNYLIERGITDQKDSPGLFKSMNNQDSSNDLDDLYKYLKGLKIKHY